MTTEQITYIMDNVPRVWWNWQTRMIQVHVRKHAGSSPVTRTKYRVEPLVRLGILLFYSFFSHPKIGYEHPHSKSKKDGRDLCRLFLVFGKSVA